MQTHQKQAHRPKMPKLMNKPNSLKIQIAQMDFFNIIFMMHTLTIASMNCHGQTKLEVPKYLYIQNILLCQETRIEDRTFEQCNFIRSNYNIIKNNAPNPYGTSVLAHVNLNIEEVKYDTEGRILISNIDEITFCNVYPKAGTDSESKQER